MSDFKLQKLLFPPLLEPKKAVLFNFALALAYFTLGRLGIHWAIPPGVSTAVWLPSGIALYSILHFGYWLWPGIFIGSFAVNILTLWDGYSFLTGLLSIAVVVGIAVASTIQAIAGAYLINKMIPPFRMWEEIPSFLRFFGISAAVCLIAPVLGTVTLSITNFSPWHYFWRSLLNWWLGDLMGILLILPLPLLFQKRGKRPSWRVLQWVEAILFSMFIVIVPFLVFSPHFFFGIKKLPLTFLLLPILIWAAFRFGRRGVAMTIWIVSPIALWGTVSGAGPFANFPHEEALWLLQFFIGIFIITGLALAVALNQQKRTELELREAIEESQKISQRKTEFASMLSHDLGTPLTVIKDNVDMVISGDEGPLTASQGETLEIVMNNVDRLARLTKNLLNFEKLESGRMEMSFKPCNIQGTVREVSRFMGVTAKKRGVVLLPEIPQHSMLVFCDEDQIKEVLVNLVDNSLKYSPQGGRIWIRLNLEENKIILEIEDEGIGIKKEDQEKIFEIFKRGSPPALARIGGAGVGLAVCKWIIELHEGEISVHSAPSKGTCFRIELPAGPHGVLASSKL